MRKYWILAVILILLCGIFIAMAVMRSRGDPLPTETDPHSATDLIRWESGTEKETEKITPAETTEAATEKDTVPVPDTSGIVTEDITSALTEPVTTEVITATKPKEKVPLVLDFTQLKKINTDIYAWISIGGEKDRVVYYPILQNAKNDKMYLTTNYDGTYYIGGSLFTEHAYNSRSFDDPVTIVYGHYMRNGNLFGSLQKTYSDKSKFQKYSDITIYLEGEVKQYKVFAAVPYDTSHILAAYDFTSKYWYKSFFKRISSTHDMLANFDESITPEYGDHILILSTCLNGDSSARYLVIAILKDDI